LLKESMNLSRRSILPDIGLKPFFRGARKLGASPEHP
jgi:hypothetical protein